MLFSASLGCRGKEVEVTLVSSLQGICKLSGVSGFPYLLELLTPREASTVVHAEMIK